MAIPSHWGHGIGIKHGHNNKIIDCVARGFAKGLYASPSDAYDNEFKNCTVFDDNLSQVVPYSDGPGALVVRDGAYNNTFIKCRVYGTRFGIWFWDSFGEGGGSGNSFANCIIDSVESGVQMEAANDNIFKNLVIINAKYLFGFKEGSVSGNNILLNSIITNANQLALGDGVVNATYSDFYNNGFATPSGEGNMERDPLFNNVTYGDYHLKSQFGRWSGNEWVKDNVTSNCIDTGDPSSDYSNESQPNGNRINIGAYGNTAEASKSKMT
jgi:hypothetical protein